MVASFDLSAFKKPQPPLSAPDVPGATPSATGSFVIEVTQENFNDCAKQSMQYPVVVEFLSSRAPECQAVDASLSQLANASGGSWVLARLNVDTQSDLAQALHVTAVPTVIVLLAGQAAPLFQGSKSHEEIQALIAQVHQVAVANGLTGRAQPIVEHDPRYQSAWSALEQGHLDEAETAFRALLADNPRDGQARCGLAHTHLTRRYTTQAYEGQCAETMRRVDDLFLAGSVEQAFSLLREIYAEAPDEVRQRYLELLDVLPLDDPVALTARRALATMLF